MKKEHDWGKPVSQNSAMWQTAKRSRCKNCMWTKWELTYKNGVSDKVLIMYKRRDGTGPMQGTDEYPECA